MTARTLLLVAAPLLVAAVVASGCSGDPDPPESHRLAYVTIEDEQWVLVIHDLESDERVIVALDRQADGGVGGDPFSVSPDGERITFVRGGYSGVVERRLWVINADGSDEHKLVGEQEPFATLFPGDQTSPKWSPDGDRIAFTVNDRGSRTILAVAAADGGGSVALFEPPEGASDTFDHRLFVRVTANPWSPDGETLAFTRMAEALFPGLEESDHAGVHLAALDGGIAGPLTDPGSLAFFQGWSPDGTRLLYSALQTDPPGFDIRVVNADGTSDASVLGVGSVGGADAVMLSPAWSPDREYIAFRLLLPDNADADLYRVDVDGGDLLQLTDEPGDDGSGGFAWAPDGRHLAVTRRVDRTSELWVIASDGSAPRLVVEMAVWPAWLP